MHQIFPCCSSASPTSQYFPPVPSGTQFATVAGALVPPGSSSSKTDSPGSRGRLKRTPHPSVFTTRVCHCSANGIAGSRLARRKGICARIRVLRRSASYDFTPELIYRPTSIVRLTPIFSRQRDRNLETKVTPQRTRSGGRRPANPAKPDNDRLRFVFDVILKPRAFSSGAKDLALPISTLVRASSF